MSKHLEEHTKSEKYDARTSKDRMLLTRFIDQ